MINKKSQLKMFETIAVLVVFFFILGIGFVFYSSVEKKSMGKAASEFEQLREVQIAQLISNMAELECPTTLETENCVDEYKLKVLKTKKLDNYYYDFFGYSTINVIVYDLEHNTQKDYPIYDKKPDNVVSSSSTQVPVSIYDPVNKIKKFGILNIKVYK